MAFHYFPFVFRSGTSVSHAMRNFTAQLITELLLEGSLARTASSNNGPLRMQYTAMDRQALSIF